jgi:hypothetical protein
VWRSLARALVPGRSVVKRISGLIDDQQSARWQGAKKGNRPVGSDDREAGWPEGTSDDCTDEKLHVCQGLEKAVAGIRGLQGTAELSRTASLLRIQPRFTLHISQRD